MRAMSTHRFDHTVDHSDDAKLDRQPERRQRIEVITGVERRRKWSLEEKVEIVVESCGEGAVISEVARRHGISPQQLFGWRKRLRTAMPAVTSVEPPTFVPAIVDTGPTRRREAMPLIAPSGEAASIEIVFGSAVVRVRGAVELRVLGTVLKALQSFFSPASDRTS